MARLATDWTRNIPQSDPQAKADLETSVLNSTVALGRLKELLQEKDLANVRGVVDYANASWAYAQADQNGYLRAVREILQLLSFLDKE
jgi:hypothetical protein